jgi:hypothetical protein
MLRKNTQHFLKQKLGIKKAHSNEWAFFKC